MEEFAGGITPPVPVTLVIAVASDTVRFCAPAVGEELGTPVRVELAGGITPPVPGTIVVAVASPTVTL
jgi:hypothetical protein